MKTLIWDFNGTILDDTALCLDIEKTMLGKRNMKADYTLEEYKEMFGFPVIDFYKELGYDFQSESYAALSDEFNAMYDANCASCRLVEGVMDKLNEAKQKGYRNVIVSASQQSRLEEQCTALGIRNYFDALIGIDDNMAFSKIAFAKKWMQESGIDPKDCFLIGDTLHDMETAEALHIENYILVSCGHQSWGRLRSNTAHVVHTIEEVIL